MMGRIRWAAVEKSAPAKIDDRHIHAVFTKSKNDAQLFVAAQDMLDTLKITAAWLSSLQVPGCQNMINEIDSAIARANGHADAPEWRGNK